MPYVESNGARLYWNSLGDGPPVLLIMGLSFTHEMWYRLTPSLIKKYRVILFDNRGMGRSDVPPGPYSIPQMAHDASVVLSAAGESSAHIIGASMGGMIAQELALRYPQRVLSLQLGCTSHGGILAHWPDFSYRPTIRQLQEGHWADREAALAPLLYADCTPPERIQEDLTIRCQCQWSQRGFWNQLSGILFWSSYLRLPQIKAPTLVVHGDQDKLIRPENGKVVASRIAGARFEMVAGAGHILTTDQPEKCVSLMLGFLREHASATAPVIANRTN